MAKLWKGLLVAVGAFGLPAMGIAAPDPIVTPDQQLPAVKAPEQPDIPADIMPQKETAPPVLTPPPPPPAAEKPPVDPNAALPKNVEPVKPNEATSVLGKKVHGPDGKDLVGSVIDILIDEQGKPRAAIIDFGGFLGVGSRKIAVDWQLLTFHPADPLAPVVLNLDRSQIQAAPEYKDPTQPAEVVEPAPPPAGEVRDNPAPPAPPAPPIAPAEAPAMPDAQTHAP